MVQNLPRSNDPNYIANLGFGNLIAQTCDSLNVRTPISPIQWSRRVLIDPWIYSPDHIATLGFEGSVPFTMITNIRQTYED